MSDQYQYECRECKNQFENPEYNFTGVVIKCPSCGSTNIRLLSLPHNMEEFLKQLRLCGG